jgi:hypothetical protein
MGWLSADKAFDSKGEDKADDKRRGEFAKALGGRDKDRDGAKGKDGKRGSGKAK